MAIDVQRVLVVGAGTMGSGIAQVAARAGYRTELFDVAPGAAQRALERVAESLGRAVEKGRCTAQERDEALRAPRSARWNAWRNRSGARSRKAGAPPKSATRRCAGSPWQPTWKSPRHKPI